MKRDRYLRSPGSTRRPAAALAIPIVGLLGGCATRGAPQLTLFGAHFPAWLLCALVGVAGGIVGRVVLVKTGLANVLPFALLVSTSIGVLTGVGAWLVWFR